MVKRILTLFVILSLVLGLTACGGPSVKDIAGTYELIDMTDESDSTENSTDDFMTALAFAKAFGIKFQLILLENKTGSLVLGGNIETLKWKPCVITLDESGNKIDFTFKGGVIVIERDGVSMTFAPSSD